MREYLDLTAFEIEAIKQAAKKPVLPRNEEGYCLGSEAKPRSDLKRTYVGTWNWAYTVKCPYCKKQVGIRSDGNFVKHGKARKKKPVSFCAECDCPIYEIDFLCEACRNE